MVRAVRPGLLLLVVGGATAGLPAPGTAQTVRGGGEDRPPALTILEVPYLVQDPSLCGGAAAAMVLRYWGDESARAADFAPLLRRELGGIRADELAARLRDLGWEALLFRGDVETVRRHLAAGRPVITLLEAAPNRHHYVVVAGIAGDSLVVHDPATAPFQFLARRELERRWVATDGLSLLALPRLPPPVAPAEPDAGEVAAAGAGGVGPGGSGAPEVSGCAWLLEGGIRLARRGREAEAGSLLEAGILRCPAPAPFLRELAGLRLREGRTEAAVGLAERAVRADPTDAHALRTLAAAYYLDGRAEPALHAWNRLGGPVLGRVQIVGGEGIHYRRAAEWLGLRSGRALTPEALRLAERRLRDLPAAAGATVRYEPLPGGHADVIAGVRERAGVDPGPAWLGRMGLEALLENEVGLAVVSPTGNGELWTARWRWGERRPALSASLEVPSDAGPPAVWRLSASWERETISERVLGEAVVSTTGAGAPPGLAAARTRVALSVASWATSWLRWEVLAELSRWPERGSQPGAGLGLDLRSADDRWRSRFGLRGWAPSRRGPSFALWHVAAGWRSAPDGEGMVWKARLGAAAAGRHAPHLVWPGAGTGTGRPALLRAHPLLADGVVVGRAFDRKLAGGGVEVVRWLGGRLLPLGVAGFVDAVHVRGERSPETLIDAGVGLRIGIPGADASLRADLARGMSDDGWAFSLGWSHPGPPLRDAPGWEGREGREGS